MRRRKANPLSEVHPAYCEPPPSPSDAEETSHDHWSFRPRALVTYILVLALCQISLVFHVLSGAGRDTPEADPRFEGIEERFSKISVVLRFLLDKSKAPPGASTASLDEPSLGSANLPLARVQPSRLNLRAGPGTNYAPIMTVGAGTVLVVEEDSPGDWSRVVAPNGARAYAQRDHLVFEGQ